MGLGLITCGRCEGVQGVLTLFCSRAAQVVGHALRVEELSGHLEVEEEDGEGQEEEEEEKGEASQRECAMDVHAYGVMKSVRRSQLWNK